LKAQNVISRLSWGGARRANPYALTEQGVAMLSSVLRSPRAVAVNIEIMRAFVRLRQMLATHEDLALKIAALEKNYDTQFKVVFDALRVLMEPPPRTQRRVGFQGNLAEEDHKGLGTPEEARLGAGLPANPGAPRKNLRFARKKSAAVTSAVAPGRKIGP